MTGSREIVHARPERRQRASCSRVATGSRACTGVQGANIAVMPNSPLLRPWGVARGCASAGQAGRSFLRTPFMTRRRQVCMQKVQKCCNPCFFRSFIITNTTPELSTTISLKNWEKHWSYSGINSCMITPFSLNFWRSCFLNISKKCLSKVNLDCYYKNKLSNY